MSLQSDVQKMLKDPDLHVVSYDCKDVCVKEIIDAVLQDLNEPTLVDLKPSINVTLRRNAHERLSVFDISLDVSIQISGRFTNTGMRMHNDLAKKLVKLVYGVDLTNKELESRVCRATFLRQVDDFSVIGYSVHFLVDTNLRDSTTRNDDLDQLRVNNYTLYESLRYILHSDWSEKRKTLGAGSLFGIQESADFYINNSTFYFTIPRIWVSIFVPFQTDGIEYFVGDIFLSVFGLEHKTRSPFHDCTHHVNCTVKYNDGNILELIGDWIGNTGIL